MGTCMIGVPKEIKTQEGRVGVTPDGVRALCALGLHVGIEQNAGVLSGFSDDKYIAAGAVIYSATEKLYQDADIIVKVKEPTPAEYQFLPLLEGKALFTYLHLAGVDSELTRLLLRHEVTAIAYENVTRTVDGRTMLPLLAPMSRIAGVQAMRGALLRHPKEHYAKLEVIILGGGVVGEAALNQALVNGVSSIAMFESREERVRELRTKYSEESTFSVFPFSFLEDADGKKLLKGADIVISGVMLPGGAAAPKVLNQSHFRIMKQGTYIADVAIDQGGSTAWSKVTKPGETFTRGKKELVFSCVPNIPGSTVPAEATEALTKETLPYICLLGTHVFEHGRNSGIYFALKDHSDLRAGLQTFRGNLLSSAVSARHQLLSVYRPFDHFF